jgi:hypothetical protein
MLHNDWQFKDDAGSTRFVYGMYSRLTSRAIIAGEKTGRALEEAVTK